MKAVEELGYAPPRRKPGPKPKRRRKGRKVLLVIPSRPDQPSDPSEVFLGSPFGRQVIAGIHQIADRERSEVEVITPVLGDAPVDTQDADGLILIRQLGSSAAPLPNVNGDLAQIVLAQRSPVRPSCDCVAINDYMSGELAVEFLLRQGCTRLAALSGFPEDAQPLARMYGYRRTAKRRDVPAYYVGPITYHADGPDRPAALDGSPKALVDQLMALPQVPDGLAVAVPSMQDLYDELRGRGIEPVRKDPKPGRSAVVLASATVRLRTNPVDPMPHLVAYSGLASGQRLMEQLLRRIERPDDPVAHILIAPTVLN